MRACIAIAFFMSTMAIAGAAEIKVISANGMREVITETRAKFEQASGHRLTITVVETGEIRRRVLGGEQYDVIMVPKAVADDFEKQGKMAPGSGVQLIRVNFGLAVAADGPRPETTTPKDLKRVFLAARTVLITDPKAGGISGVHLMEVLDKLGITEQMKDKLVPNPGGGFHAAPWSRARPISPCRPSTKSVACAARPSCPTRRNSSAQSCSSAASAQQPKRPRPRRATSPSSKVRRPSPRSGRTA